MTVCSFWMLDSRRKLKRRVNLFPCHLKHFISILLFLLFCLKMHPNKLVNLKFCFFCEEAAEPVKGKKRKGKSSRPLRIDLILQHDSLVAPPKESVILVSSDP